MAYKKAQITFFVITSLLILTIIVVFFLIKNSFNTKMLNEKQSFLDEKCIDKIFEDTMIKLGKQGGTLKDIYTKRITFNDENIKVRYGLKFYIPGSVKDWVNYGYIFLPNINEVKKEVEEEMKTKVENKCNYKVLNSEVVFNDEKTLLFMKLKKDNNNYNFRREYDLPLKKILNTIRYELYKEKTEENHNFESFYNDEFNSYYYGNIDDKDDLFVLETKNTVFNGKKYFFMTLIQDRVPKVKKRVDEIKCGFEFNFMPGDINNPNKIKFLNLKLLDGEEDKIIDVDEKDVYKTNYDVEVLECSFVCGGHEKKVEAGMEVEDCAEDIKNDLRHERIPFYVKKLKLTSDRDSYEGTI